MWPSQRKQAREAGRLVEENHAKIERAREESKKQTAEFVAKYDAKAAADEKELKEANQRMKYPRPSKVLTKIAKEKGDVPDQEALELILSSFGRDLILIDLFKNVIIPMQEKIAKLEDDLGAQRSPEYHDRKKMADDFLQQYWEQYD